MYYDLKIISDNGNMIDFGIEHNIVISDIQGLTAINVNIVTSQGISQIGTSVQDQTVDSKPFIINGEILGLSVDYRKKLIDTIVPMVGVTIIYDNKFEMYAYPQITPDISRHKYNAKFQFTLYAAYPYWRNIETIQVPLSGIDKKFKFPMTFTSTVYFTLGERIVSEFINVRNNGNVSIPFDIIFYTKTKAANPMVSKVTTREFIRIEKEMVADEKIKMTMVGENITITSTSGGMTRDIFGSLDIDSTLFELDIGDNLLKFDAELNRNSIDCFVNTQEAYSGAWGNDRIQIRR